VDLTGDSTFVLAICVVAAAWVIFAVGLWGLQEHHRAIAWRRTARRSRAMAPFRHGRRPASATSGPDAQPASAQRGGPPRGCSAGRQHPSAAEALPAAPHRPDRPTRPAAMSASQNGPTPPPSCAPPLAADRDRVLTATVIQWARTNGWRGGHRLGWIRSDATIAVSWRPGVLEVWWRSIAGRWPTTPVSYPVARVDEAVHILVGLKLLPDVLGQRPCGHGPPPRPCASADRAAVSSAGIEDAALTEQLWRVAAHQPRGLAASKLLP